MKHSKAAAFVGGMMLSLAMAAAGATYHVSPQVIAGVGAGEQFRSIAEAAARVEPGDRVRIHAGTYREAVVIERSGAKDRPVRFEAAPASDVVVTGADRLSNWRREPGTGDERVYSTDWTHRFIPWSKSGTHPGDDYHKLIGRAEQVFAEGYPLQQVLSREKLSRGTFFADVENKRLYVQTADNAELSANGRSGARIEASTRGVLWDVRGDYVQTRGIRFRYAANQAQQGAATFLGRGAVVEDCIFERTNAEGATFRGPDQVVRRCTFRENGQFGWSAGEAHNLLMTGCLIELNNTKNFDRGWGAGGVKIVLTRGMIIERSRFLNNRGCGVWFDIGNEDCTVRNCLIADNEDAGIFYEISYGLRAYDNVITGNGLASGGGAWGANGGIALSSSPGCVIERNLLVANKEGFQFREQMRRTPRIAQKKGDPAEWVWNHDQVVRNNVFAYNRVAQVWGWFGIDDERHWPTAMQSAKRRNQPAEKPAADVAGPYQANPDAAAPRDLSLEKLNLKFENNLYASHPEQGLFNWGPDWSRNRKFTDLETVRKELSLETGQRLAEFQFHDYPTRDFRVPANSPALKAGAYPKGEVPGVRLGIDAGE